MKCPLCANETLQAWKTRAHSPQWRYYRCSSCDLVFRDIKSWPNAQQEKERYQFHSNQVGEQGYLDFLGRILPEIESLVPQGTPTLDFGCGPSPVLAQMLKAKGYPTMVYDPFFFEDPDVLQKRFGLICATEVMEHLYRPGETMDLLVEMLNPKGVLAIMTQPVPEKDFDTWHYLSDLTHVVFYSLATMEYIAKRWYLNLVKSHNDLFYFQKR